MADRIPVKNIVVIQKQQGGIAPRLQLQLGPDGTNELFRRIEAANNLVYERVEAERADATTRGVQVVLDDTKPDHFLELRRPD
jgi:hypothetical protein